MERVLVMVGAEGVQELEGQPWAREVNDDAAWEQLAQSVGMPVEKVREMRMDGTRRPYFLVELGDDAPAAALDHAKRSLRVVRLRVQ